MTRDEAIAKLQGDCNCVSMSDSRGEPFFSQDGCDICRMVNGRRLGGNVYAVNGYNVQTEQIEDLGQVCGECLCYIMNGE